MDNIMETINIKSNLIIEITDLKKSYGENHILEGFNMKLYEGENLVVMGKSGSGKSVMIKCLIGLEKPDSGSIMVMGKDINKLDKANVATKCTMYRCEYCLSERFLTKEKLFNHIEKCKNNNKCIDEVLPEEGKNILKFQNNNNKLNAYFF